MLSIFLPFFVLSKEYIYPKITYLMVGYAHSQKEAQENIEWHIKRAEANCKRWDEEGEFKEDENLEQCIAFHKSILTFTYSEASNINNALSKVSSATDLLYIHGCNLTSIDFNNLKKQMIVEINPYCPIGSRDKEDKNERMLSMYRNLQKIIGAKNLNNIQDRSKYIKRDFDDSSLISLNGNIKDKVSNLKISNAYIKIINDDINVNTLQLLYTKMHEDTKKIRTDNFITEEDFFTYNEELYQNTDLIQVKQFLYITYFQKRYVSSYQIEYKSESWEINNIQTQSLKKHFHFLIQKHQNSVLYRKYQKFTLHMTKKLLLPVLSLLIYQWHIQKVMLETM